MTHTETLSAIQKMRTSDVYQQLQMKLEESSYHEIIGAQDRETTHSNFIYWLFNTNQFTTNHQSPIVLLLQLLAVKASQLVADQIGNIETYFANKGLYNAVCFNDIECNIKEVKREDRTRSSIGNGFADVVIKLEYSTADENAKPLTIVIENKIGSKESENQCKKYYDHFAKDEGEKIFVFLSPKSPCTQETNGLSCEHFIPVTYQDLYDYLLRPIWVNRSKYSEENTNRLKTYLDTICSLTSFLDFKVMDNKTQALLRRFFEDNKELILAAVQSSDDSEMVTQVQEAISNNNIRIHYNLAYNGKTFKALSRAKLVKKVVEILVHDKGFTYTDLTKFFSDAQVGNNNLSTQQDKKNYKEEVSIDETTYYLNMNKWTYEAINLFIKKVESSLPDLKITPVG